MNFEDELKEILNHGSIKELQNLEGKVVDDKTGTFRNDGNNVNVTSEMNEMSQNGILYSLIQQAFKSKMSIVKSAIR